VSLSFAAGQAALCSGVYKAIHANNHVLSHFVICAPWRHLPRLNGLREPGPVRTRAVGCASSPSRLLKLLLTHAESTGWEEINVPRQTH
jgi:hypothetical protein